jgi:hypothetical protein
MNYKYIYLVFTKTGTWLSKLIYTFSHKIMPIHPSVSTANLLKCIPLVGLILITLSQVDLS